MARRTAAAALPSLARRIVSVVAECNYAQRRVLALQTAPDTFLADPDKAADDYAEFLFRTSSALRREPSAADRARCRPVG